MEGEHVDDFLPLDNELDLRDLLLTIPVFEIAPMERKAWLYKEGILTNNSIILEGDGAQSTLKLSRTYEKNHYKLDIGPHEDQIIYSYTLLRVEGGWKVISRNETKA